jgi:hypothetical protein
MRSETLASRADKWVLPAVALSFLACYFCTAPDYIGDTTRYAADAAGRGTQFWEFGHLLWRPWGFLGVSLMGAWFARAFGDVPAQATARFLIGTSFLCSFGALILLTNVIRKAVGPWLAMAVVFTLECSVAFINYSHSGTPYIPALLFSALTIYLLMASVDATVSKAGRLALAAGVSFAVAFALWFPYVFSGLGMLAVLGFWSAADRGQRRRLILFFLGATTVSALLLFAAGAAAKGIASPAQLMQWIRESDNGWQQTGRAMRAVTGVPRGIWSVGTDTIMLKRWLFHDPFNPVSLFRPWAYSLGGKLALFYIALGATVWVTWKESRAALFMLAASGIPLLLFAILLFEPSSHERFLPVFPFAFLAFAVALAAWRRRPVAAGCVCLLLCGMVAVNLTDYWRGSARTALGDTHRRIDALNLAVQPGALVFLMTFNDNLYALPPLNPLDHSLTSPRFRVTDTVMLASEYLPKWRAEFAGRSLEQWAANREVWISERLLAPKPLSEWKWVEGDDRRIHWPDLPALFGQLEFDARIQPGRDGFLRVAPDTANRALLAREATLAGP